MAHRADPADEFDVENTVKVYQALTRLQEAEQTPKGKAVFAPMLLELRKRSAKWNGGDLEEVAEVACGGGDC